MLIYNYKFLKGLNIHESWKEFFQRDDVTDELKKIETMLNQGINITPSASKVLRFATTDLLNIKVTLIGKDTYPQQGIATGRSFEVSGATSWDNRSINISLKNIIKLINKSCTGKKVAASIKEVRYEIKSGEYNIPPPDVAFSYWEEQGVLFLNTAFTCQVGGINNAGSHLELWKTFFKMLMDYMTANNGDIKYFLWGDAKKYSKPLQKRGVKETDLYTSNHPSANGDTGGYENGSKFLNCPCFLDTKDVINWTK